MSANLSKSVDRSLGLGAERFINLRAQTTSCWHYTGWTNWSVVSNIRANYTWGPTATVEAEGEGSVTAARKEEGICRLGEKERGQTTQVLMDLKGGEARERNISGLKHRPLKTHIYFKRPNHISVSFWAWMLRWMSIGGIFSSTSSEICH